jgi:hypothetical protein
MARSEARPLSTAEAALAATFAYLVLLISLVGARIGREDDEPRRLVRGPTVLEVAHVRPLVVVQPVAAAGPVAAARPVAAADPVTGTHPTSADRPATAGRPAAAAQPAGRTARSSCVTARTRPVSYAAASDVTEPLAFGPPVESSGRLSAAAVNGVLIERLCYRPDPLLYTAISAAADGGDPNRALTRAQWAAGVDQLITHDGLFVDARVVTRTVPRGTATYGMRLRPGARPLVVRTRLAHQDTSRYLLLPVRSASGRVVTLTLRLRCGFQPIFPQ